MENLILNGATLNIDDVYIVSKDPTIKITLAAQARQKMKKARDYIQKVVERKKPVYGINTGFGALADKQIKNEDLSQLQVNLIRSHCTGVGSMFSEEIVRAIMLLRINCLVSGFSGVQIEAVELLLDFLNNNIIPQVPEQGSVGASGDLAPLSHIALCLIGEGDVTYDGKIVNSAFAIDQIGKKPIVLGPKDGLALINGTAVMAALGSLACAKAIRLIKLADLIAATTLEAVRGTQRAFDPRIHQLKPHIGQINSAKNVLMLLANSEIMNSHEECGKVQDPYSLRCVPQVHGACRQTYLHARDVLNTELNSVTDNPLIFVDDDDVISGGNFHGEALAFCMDYLAMGISELANISERRIEKMMNPTFSDLPHFLTESSGLNSGLMIAHVTAAALVSENKVLSHPSSVDSVPTSTDKEDHVSMGVMSGRKLHQIIENTKNVLAIEILCNTQGLDFLRPLKSSPPIETLRTLIRKHVPTITDDRPFYKDINNIRKLIDNDEILNAVNEIIGELL